jgi:hypothetical protein
MNCGLVIDFKFPGAFCSAQSTVTTAAALTTTSATISGTINANSTTTAASFE